MVKRCRWRKPPVGYGRSKRPVDVAALYARAPIDVGDDESPGKLYIETWFRHHRQQVHMPNKQRYK